MMGSSQEALGWAKCDMGLNVVFISGVRRSGKSALIQGMLDTLCESPQHYIRLVNKASRKAQQRGVTKPTEPSPFASAQWLEYDSERVFEVLPDALAAIHKTDRFGSVLIEADADPALRHAYAYDHRIFVMPIPAGVQDVFRDPTRAAEELKRVLDDTAVFASEIFGLFDDENVDDPQSSEERADMTPGHARSFLYSPLGDELATRIQLQPPYHGLVESDVIVVNSQVGKLGPGPTACVQRIDRLLDRVKQPDGTRPQLFFCNPVDKNGRDCKKLLKSLKPMCQCGR